MCRMHLINIQLREPVRPVRPVRPVKYHFRPTVTVELLRLVDNSNTARLNNSKWV
jgi:hypothetical protein